MNEKRYNQIDLAHLAAWLLVDKIAESDTKLDFDEFGEQLKKDTEYYIQMVEYFKKESVKNLDDVFDLREKFGLMFNETND